MVLDQLGTKEVNAENLTEVMTRLRERLILNNFTAIIRSATRKEMTTLDNKWHEETHSPRKLNSKVKTSDEKTKEQISLEESEDFILSH